MDYYIIVALPRQLQQVQLELILMSLCTVVYFNLLYVNYT